MCHLSASTSTPVGWPLLPTPTSSFLPAPAVGTSLTGRGNCLCRLSLCVFSTALLYCWALLQRGTPQQAVLDVKISLLGVQL